MTSTTSASPITTTLLSLTTSSGMTSNPSTTSSPLMSSLSQNILSQSLSQSSIQTTLGSHSTLAQTLSQPLSQSLSSQTQNSSQSSAPLSQTAIKNPVVILDKIRLQELVQEVDPNEQLEEDVEDMLLMIADDFIESLVSTSAMIAKHRKSSTLDVRDVQLALEKNWKMWIPGFGSDDIKPHKKSYSTEAHKQRMALIRKTLKKF